MKIDARQIIGNRNSVELFSRRDMLGRLGAGMGTLGLASVLDNAAVGAPAPHFAPKAKRIIQLFMPGGPSHVDTFDYKPDIAKYEGQRPEQVDLRTLRKTHGLFKPLWDFKQYGKSGKWVSDLFPYTGKLADDICFLHGMHTDIPEHAGGILMMNSGHLQPIRPSMGAWMMYGLGTENHNLPGFIVLAPGAGPRGTKGNWGTSFLPGSFAGTHVDMNSVNPATTIHDLTNQRLGSVLQREQVDLIKLLNQQHLQRREQDADLEASIASMELAFRMQSAVPEAFDIGQESKGTHELYGDQKFGKSCLLARRLAERGVRMIMVSGGNDIHWDHHDRIALHERTCLETDQGIAALLMDLKQRGMLDDTLVMWGGEFGRSPTADGTVGRDHNHFGFTVWLAGGGVKPGYSHGATCNFGMRAVENRMHVHDLHATIMHLMGLDHKKLTYRYSGRDYRLTDVHGKVAYDIIA